MRKFLSLLRTRIVSGFFCLLASWATGQELRIEPPNWWRGFKNDQLQLVVNAEGIGSYQAAIDYPGIHLQRQHQADSPNYLFLDLRLTDVAKAGEVTLYFRKSGAPPLRGSFQLLERARQPGQIKGFSSSDVICLITPDRFANGNPGNDDVEGMRERGTDRNAPFARHGGDIQGIIDHLDYIAEMGFTAIWPSPLLENDMPEQSYHGYAITDYYQVDPRFGTLADYKALADKAREKGIKLVMDQVANHCGREHWWMDDLPFTDWVHYQDRLLSGDAPRITNHRRTTNQDPYGSRSDAALMEEGWFVSAMPDLNQDNPFLAEYLVQNSIWWIETLGLGGIRQDTYPYPDKEFMALWAGRIMEEYPEFSIVGEEWSYNPLLVGYWQNGARNKDGYESNLTSAMDFPMQSKVVSALKEEEAWDTGLVNLYEALANDFYYPDPSMMLAFPDNHDMDRIHTQLDEDPVLTRMALAYLLSIPRTSQLYYGTEILMENSEHPHHHGHIRTDFPGGWEGDKVNAFTGTGLTKAQRDMQAWLRTLLNFRKDNPAYRDGKTVHFAPENGVYLLARQSGGSQVILILNKNNEPINLHGDRFKELGLQDAQLTELFSGASLPWKDALNLPEKGAYIYYK